MLNIDETELKVLLVTSDAHKRVTLRLDLTQLGVAHISDVLNYQESFTMLEQQFYDVAFFEYHSSDPYNYACLQKITEEHPYLRIILFSESFNQEQIGRLIRLGVENILATPFRAPAILTSFLFLIHNETRRYEYLVNQAVKDPTRALITFRLEGEHVTSTEFIKSLEMFEGLELYRIIGPLEILALARVNVLDKTLGLLIDAFYTSPLARNHPDLLLTFGYAIGGQPTDSLIEALSLDFIERRRSQGVTSNENPRVLLLQPERRELMRRFSIATSLIKEYTKEYNQAEIAALRELERLTASLRHDLRSPLALAEEQLEQLKGPHQVPPGERIISRQQPQRDTFKRLAKGTIAGWSSYDPLAQLHRGLRLCQLLLTSVSAVRARVRTQEELDIVDVIHKNCLLAGDLYGQRLQINIISAERPLIRVSREILDAACLAAMSGWRAAGATTVDIYASETILQDRVVIEFRDNGKEIPREMALQLGFAALKYELPLADRRVALLPHLLQSEGILFMTSSEPDAFIMNWLFPKHQTNYDRGFYTLGELRDEVQRLEHEAQQRRRRIQNAVGDVLETSEVLGTILVPYLAEMEMLLDQMVFDARGLLDQRGDPTLNSNIIPNQLRRAHLLVRNLLLMFIRPDLTDELVDINECVREALDACVLSPTLTVHLALSSDLPTIRASFVSVTQLLVNLLTNARDATAETGSIIVKTSRQGPDVALLVEDDGIGILPEHKKKIFELFFSTKGRGPDTGIGLTIVSRIVEDLGGKVAICSTSHNESGALQTWQRGSIPPHLQHMHTTGTRFLITIPISA